jgi:hypothetical protein
LRERRGSAVDLDIARQIENNLDRRANESHNTDSWHG